MVEDGGTLLLPGAGGWPVIPVKSTMLRYDEARDEITFMGFEMRKGLPRGSGVKLLLPELDRGEWDDASMGLMP